MKLFTILLICLVVSQSYALTRKQVVQSQKTIETLKKDKSWSKIVLSLAELHMMSDFPLADLVDAVEQLVEDLQEKSQNEANQWQEKTEKHHAEVGRLNGEVDSAVTDISNTTDNLENHLYPRRRDLEETIKQSDEKIANNNHRLEQIHNQREKDHGDFVVRAEEHNAAVAALEEALSLLQSLVSGSFVQVKFAKQNLQKIGQKLGQHLHETLAKALVQLATSEFADVRLVQDVIQKLTDIKDKIASSLIEEKKNEDREQEAHDDETKRLEQNNDDNEVRKANASTDLEQTNYSVKEQESFKAEREADLANWNNDLKVENENFDSDQSAHDDLSAQLEGEVNAASQALSILRSGEFSEYLNERLGGVKSY